MGDRKTALFSAVAGLSLLLLAGCGDHSTPPDNGTPPSVTIQLPHEGDSLSAVGFTLRGIASDEDGLAAVRLIADGTVLKTIDYSPFSFTFPACLFDEGDLTITVQAEDTKGAKGSASVEVHLKDLALRSIGSASDQEREPAWSPDGTMIAFSSEGMSGNRDIYIVDAAGGEPTQVTTSVNDDISPDWSSSGSWIAFASNRTGNWDIWAVEPSGDDEHPVTTNGMADRGPVWSPNFSRIAFHSNRDGNWNLYAVQVSGAAVPLGAETALTAAASAESAAAWIADESLVAFATNQLGGSDIFTVAPPSTILSAVPGANDGTVRELDPAYAPEGGYLLFSDNRNGNSDIWVLDPSTNRKRVLAANLATDREPAWSPDGDRIAFASNRSGTYDIWVME